MKPNTKFLNKPGKFWANIRAISEVAGYSEKGKNRVKAPAVSDLSKVSDKTNICFAHLFDKKGRPNAFGKVVFSYFTFRAKTLNEYVEPLLMDVEEAKRIFTKLKRRLKPQCPIPMNKQKGEKKSPAYLTGIVNMLVEENSAGFACDYDPRRLITITRDGAPLRTLSRRVDGAFPQTVNPIAIWEIKEYYYTTTFGSRVADGIYETLLDGMEIAELREHENVDVMHYLMVDARYTWWDCGRSYLCRIFDMLHMGFVDEVLFGREVVERLPLLVKDWVKKARKKG